MFVEQILYSQCSLRLLFPITPTTPLFSHWISRIDVQARNPSTAEALVAGRIDPAFSYAGRVFRRCHEIFPVLPTSRMPAYRYNCWLNWAVWDQVIRNTWSQWPQATRTIQEIHSIRRLSSALSVSNTRINSTTKQSATSHIDKCCRKDKTVRHVKHR